MSKSKLAVFRSCPLKFKLLYVDKLKQPKTGYERYANIGNDVHKAIENFYKNDVKIEEKDFKNVTTGTVEKKPVIIMNKEKYKKNKYMKNFIKLKEEILRKSNDNKHFFPVSQEIDYYSKDINIHGLIDAVYKHYTDDEYIIIDWKSGKIKDLNDMRKELAFYKLCLDGSGKTLKPVKYWGMYFVKHDYLFFEEVREEFCDIIKNEVKLVQDLIDNKYFEKNEGVHCRWCGFRGTRYCTVNKGLNRWE